jgi:hypothetical protein
MHCWVQLPSLPAGAARVAAKPAAAEEGAMSEAQLDRLLKSLGV